MRLLKTFNNDYHSIGLFPFFAKIEFVWLKCLFPNQYPLLALRGEGCPLVRTRCFKESISFIFCFAKPPQSKNINPSLSWDNFWIAASVKTSQPLPWWLPA